MKKLLSSLMVVTILVMLFTACTQQIQPSETEGPAQSTAGKNQSDQANEKEQQKPSSKDKVNLSFWVTFSTPDREAFVNEVVSKYKEDNPYVTVDVTCLPDNGIDKAKVSYSAGQGPDVYRTQLDNEFITAGYIIPLDEYFDKWDGKENLLDGSIQNARLYDPFGKNQLYFIPMGTQVTVLWARSDWVKEANGSLDNWDNLFDTVKKMTNKEKSQYGLAIRGGAGGAQFLERMMYSYSGILSLYDENGIPTINHPKNVEFVERYLGLYGEYTAEGDVGYGWTELSAAFDSGNAGLIIHNLGSANDHLKAFNNDLSKFEALGMPYNEKGTSVNMLKQDSGFTISATCKNPDDGFNLIAAFNEPEAASAYCNLWGTVPMNKVVLENAEWLKEYPWFEAACKLILDENTLYYNNYPWLPGMKTIWKEIDTEIQFVMLGEMTSQEMCDHWAELLVIEYDEYYNK